mgnify:CR=1 FL=1
MLGATVFAMGQVLVGEIVATGALLILRIATVGAVNIVLANLFATANAALLLYSVGCLQASVENKPLKEFDNAKSNQRK